MEAYEIFKIKDDQPEDYIDPNRQLMDQLLARVDGMLKGNMTDIASKIKAELLMGHCFFGSRNDAVDAFITAASTYYKTLSIADQRNTDATLRDIIETFGEEIKTGDKQYMDILDEYLEFKTKIDTISPEAAAEVDRLAEMSDEEFEAEMNKPDEDEEEEETEELDTSITQDDFDNLSITELIEKYGSHDTALCLIGAEGGEEKFTMDDMKLFDAADQELLRQEFGTSPDAPTEEFNPEYDIPDEKLYPQE